MTAKVEPAHDETSLVEQARAGSRAAFEALVRRYQKPVYFLCVRYVRDHDAAADLTQRVFIRVLDSIGELRDPQTFRSWLFRIGANLSLNHLRDSGRFVSDEGMVAADEGRAAAPEAELRIEAEEESAALRKAVAQLPTKQRMTLELRVFEDMPFRDVAAALGTTEGAAKVNFHFAVRRLRGLLAGSASGKVGKS